MHSCHPSWIVVFRPCHPVPVYRPAPYYVPAPPRPVTYTTSPEPVEQPDTGVSIDGESQPYLILIFCFVLLMWWTFGLFNRRWY